MREQNLTKYLNSMSTMKVRKPFNSGTFNTHFHPTIASSVLCLTHHKNKLWVTLGPSIIQFQTYRRSSFVEFHPTNGDILSDSFNGSVCR